MSISDTSSISPIARSINYWLEYDDVSLAPILDYFIAALDAWKKRTRRRKQDDLVKLQGTLKAILLDLIVACYANPDRYLRVSKRKEWYSERGSSAGLGRYHNPLVTYEPVQAVISFLIEGGYVEILPGFQDRGSGVSRQSAIRATQKLVQAMDSFGIDTDKITSSPRQETVKLKDENKALMGYADTDETHHMRSNLYIINSALGKADIELSLGSYSLSELLMSHQEKQRREAQEGNQGRQDIDFSRTRLTRIFNNGSFDLGGRFYGGWWQSIPKKYRSHIQINGEATAELDYQSMHPLMLYHMEGLDPPSNQDLYVIPGIEFNGAPEDARSLVKSVVQMLFNARTIHGLTFDDPAYVPLLPVGMTFKGLAKAIMLHHAPIGHYFLSGVGLKLQRVDSDIAETVMMNMISEGTIALPIHDGFRVPISKKQILREVMREVYFNRLGHYPRIK